MSGGIKSSTGVLLTCHLRRRRDPLFITIFIRLVETSHIPFYIRLSSCLYAHYVVGLKECNVTVIGVFNQPSSNHCSPSYRLMLVVLHVMGLLCGQRENLGQARQ